MRVMTSISGISNRTWTVALLVIVAAAAGLRLFHLDTQSFFLDEAVQVRLASLPVKELLSMRYTWDVLPPGTMLLLHFWMKLGDSDFWVRLLFAIAGIANVLALAALARDWIGSRAGLIAALLMAVNPFHVWYSQEARPYVFLMLFCTLHVWFFMRCVRESRAGSWLGFGLCAAAALYSHVFALFTLGVEFLFAAFTVRNRRFWFSYMVAGSLVLACFIPYVFMQLLRMPEVTLGSPRPVSWIVLPFSFYTWLFGFAIGPSVTELHWNLSAAGYARYAMWMIPTLAAGGLWLWGICRGGLPPLPRRRWGFLLGWMVLPLVVVFILSKISRGTFNVRYVCEAFLPFVILVAWGIDCFSTRRRLTLAVLCLVLLGAGISLGRTYFLPKYWKEDVRSAVLLLNGRGAPHDLLLIPESFAFRHYHRGTGRVMLISDALGLIREEPEVVLPARRIWLVYYREWQMDPEHAMKRWLDSRWILREQYEYPNCQVFGYDPR